MIFDLNYFSCKKRKQKIYRIQSILKGLGYKIGKIDGILGSKTKSSIVQYQYDNNLKIDGKISDKLLMELNKKIKKN